jgi:hypothetical protein
MPNVHTTFILGLKCRTLVHALTLATQQSKHAILPTSFALTPKIP